MTTPMPDHDLADLRNTLERATEFYGEITARHITAGYTITIVPLASIDIDDVRALVARLDAAERSAADWNAYADLFREQSDRIMPFAIAHGWRGDDDLYERGKALRARLGLPERESTDG